MITATDIEVAAKKAIDELAAQIPPFPDDRVCVECRSNHDWQVYEYGYNRWTTLEWDGDQIFAVTAGWDDLSEDSELEAYRCNNCDTLYQSDGEYDWC